MTLHWINVMIANVIHDNNQVQSINQNRHMSEVKHAMDGYSTIQSTKLRADHQSINQTHFTITAKHKLNQ